MDGIVMISGKIDAVLEAHHQVGSPTALTKISVDLPPAAQAQSSKRSSPTA